MISNQNCSKIIKRTNLSEFIQAKSASPLCIDNLHPIVTVWSDCAMHAGGRNPI
jgi:hypothetical protein